MEKPLIYIDLPLHLQDFLRHEFEKDKDTDALLVEGSADIGKFIQAVVTVSDRPRKQPMTETTIALLLPITSWNHAIFEENFIYVPEWKQKQLRDYIEAQYRIRIREYFLVGYEKGYKQDVIIKAFLQNYNIKNNVINYDTIKKYDYRNRRKVVAQVKQEIQLSLDLF